MSDTQKKTLVILAVVVALGLAGFSAYKSIASEKTSIGAVYKMPPGSKPGKQAEMDAMKGNGSEQKSDQTSKQSSPLDGNGR